MVVNRLSKEGGRGQESQHSSPPARAGSALTRAVVSFFGGPQVEQNMSPEKVPEESKPSSKSGDSAEAALKVALDQQAQTMQMMADLVKSSLEAGCSPGASQVTGQEQALKDDCAKDAQIAQLQSQVESLQKQVESLQKQLSQSTTTQKAKAKVQSVLPFKAVTADKN